MAGFLKCFFGGNCGRERVFIVVSMLAYVGLPPGLYSGRGVIRWWRDGVVPPQCLVYFVHGEMWRK